MTNQTLLLTRREVSELLTLDDCMGAVTQAFTLAASGRIPRARVLGFPAQDGGFHIKAAALTGEPAYFAVKLNGNFFLIASVSAYPTSRDSLCCATQTMAARSP